MLLKYRISHLCIGSKTFVIDRNDELIEIVNKIIIFASSWLFILLYEWCTVTRTSHLYSQP